ncbi:MAG TPA: DUF559 domain-containing protein [Hyphomicrobiaceae bacterium]|nr:DUF559 domain-containing protein [Hyphomicrobiaceae bacterium]
MGSSTTRRGWNVDAARDADLHWRDFKVLRFRNDEVRDSMPGVTLDMLAALGAVEKPEWMERDDRARSPTPNPSPLGGGGPVGVRGAGCGPQRTRPAC